MTLLRLLMLHQPKKEAIKDRDKQEATKNILLIVEELEPLYDDAARFAPGAFS